ncbi:MAG: uroporphyrinogen decarboxylase family protein [Fimbriimonadales bacterium]
MAAIRGEPVDRIPVAQHNYPFAARHVGITLREFSNNPEKAAQALADTAYDFGYDCIIAVLEEGPLAEAMGAGIESVEDQPGRVARPAVRSLHDVPGLPIPDPTTDGRLPQWLETTRLLRSKVGDDLAIMARADQGPFGLAFLLEDPQDFLMDLLTEEEPVIRAAIEHCAKAGLPFARAQLAAGADLTSIGDSPAGQSVVSPEIYRRFAQPYERDYKVGLGSDVLSLHICGDTDKILGGMVDTGCEVLELDYPNDLDEVFKSVDGRACVWGNLDRHSRRYCWMVMFSSHRVMLSGRE